MPIVTNSLWLLRNASTYSGHEVLKVVWVYCEAFLALDEATKRQDHVCVQESWSRAIEVNCQPHFDWKNTAVLLWDSYLASLGASLKCRLAFAIEQMERVEDVAHGKQWGHGTSRGWWDALEGADTWDVQESGHYKWIVGTTDNTKNGGVQGGKVMGWWA